jgi:hypothetical protein
VTEVVSVFVRFRAAPLQTSSRKNYLNIIIVKIVKTTKSAAMKFVLLTRDLCYPFCNFFYKVENEVMGINITFDIRQQTWWKTKGH